MSLRGTCHCNFKFIAKLFSHKSYQICRIFEIPAGSCPSERKVAAKRQHMVYAVFQIIFKLLFDSLTSVSDACEMCYRSGSCLFNHLTHIQVLSYVCAAGAVCTGNILWLKLAQLPDCSREIFHSLVCFWWKKLERKQLSFFHHFR